MQGADGYYTHCDECGALLVGDHGYDNRNADCCGACYMVPPSQRKRR